MNAVDYARLAAVIFAIVAVLQLLRAVLGWPVTIDTAVVPIWASWLACIVAAALAWLGFSATTRT